MLSLVFLFFALIDVYILSQLDWWHGSIFVLFVLVILFRKGSKMSELIVATAVYIYLVTLFVADQHFLVAALGYSLGVAAILLVAVVTDRYCRSKRTWYIQSLGLVVLSILVFEVVSYISVYRSVELAASLGSLVLSIALGCILISSINFFLRLQPGE